jgi:hypothetical protein
VRPRRTRLPTRTEFRREQCVLCGEAVVEIRRLLDVEDFGEEFTPNEEIAKVKY